MLISILLSIIFSLLLIITVASYMIRMLRPSHSHGYDAYGYQRRSSILPIVLLCLGLIVIIGQTQVPDVDAMLEKVIALRSETNSAAEENVLPVELSKSTQAVKRDDLSSIGNGPGCVSCPPIHVTFQSAPVITRFGAQYKASNNFKWALSALEDLKKDYPTAKILYKEEAKDFPYKIVYFSADSKGAVINWCQAHSSLDYGPIVSVKMVGGKP